MSRHAGKGAKDAQQAQIQPPMRPGFWFSSLQMILSFVGFVLERFTVYIGTCLVGWFLILPALPYLKDIVKQILAAPPDQIKAFGDMLQMLLKAEETNIITMLCGILGISFLINILFWFNNRRNIAKIGELRKKLEENDPGGRSSSGLNKYGDRA